MTPKNSAAPPRAKPEAGLDLVEDQQDPELLGERAHLLVETRLGHDPLGVAEDRLDDDRGDLLAALLEEGAQPVDPVVAGGDDRVGDRGGDPATPCQGDRSVGVAELGHVVRPDADQRVVVDAVVLALELHDALAPGERAGEAHGMHRRLRAGHGHARHVDPAGELAHELDRADLVLTREAEAHALAHALVDVVVDARVAVSQDDRPIAHPKVDELVAVGIPDDATLAAIDVDRALAPRAEVRVGSAGHPLRGAPEQRELAVAAEAWGDAGGAGSVAMSSSGDGVGRPEAWDGRCAIRDARALIVPHGSKGPSTRHSSGRVADATNRAAADGGATNTARHAAYVGHATMTA